MPLSADALADRIIENAKAQGSATDEGLIQAIADGVVKHLTEAKDTVLVEVAVNTDGYNHTRSGTTIDMDGFSTATIPISPSMPNSAYLVQLTPNHNPGGHYWYTNTATGGFDLHLSATATSTLTFSWTAYYSGTSFGYGRGSGILS